MLVLDFPLSMFSLPNRTVTLRPKSCQNLLFLTKKRGKNAPQCRFKTSFRSCQAKLTVDTDRFWPVCWTLGQPRDGSLAYHFGGETTPTPLPLLVLVHSRSWLRRCDDTQGHARLSLQWIVTVWRKVSQFHLKCRQCANFAGVFSSWSVHLWASFRQICAHLFERASWARIRVTTPVARNIFNLTFFVLTLRYHVGRNFVSQYKLIAASHRRS